MQHFKEVSQTDQVQKLPLAAVWTSRYTSVSFVRVASSTLIRYGWVFISVRSVENCISVERLNTLNTDLQPPLQNIKKFTAG